ncbi:MAG: HAMP domain-containing histidine kinase, partial [Myxococcales bacterium]|nr:HAMP domain-containing histidine kinase [Myxococcales bacterium]
LPPLGDVVRADLWLGPRAYEIDIAAREVGLVLVYHVILRDVTERKEEAERLDQLARDLAIARDQAQAADRAKSAFLASMSHELRTPLNAILGYSELVAEQIELPEAQADLARVHAAGLHLLRLVDDVLDLARVESGVVTLSHEPLDALELLHEVVDAVQLRAAAAGKSLEVQCEVVAFRSNRQRCTQILTNLVVNAVKYAVPGRVVIGARPGELWVEDEGPGLDEEDERRIFEPFTRLQDGGEGVGLGLSVARKLARALGGDLVVSRSSLGGARFTLELSANAILADATLLERAS